MKVPAVLHLSRITFSVNAFLSVLMLFTPIIWMEIGPLGKAYYGPTVPDIYIYGGIITGKDLNWTPILMAMIFQCVMICLVAFLCVTGAMLAKTNRKWSLRIAGLIAIFLLLFPLWMSMYSGHVINNSDGAAKDLTVHFGVGALIFIAIALVHLITIATLMTRKKDVE